MKKLFYILLIASPLTFVYGESYHRFSMDSQAVYFFYQGQYKKPVFDVETMTMKEEIVNLSSLGVKFQLAPYYSVLSDPFYFKFSPQLNINGDKASFLINELYINIDFTDFALNFGKLIESRSFSHSRDFFNMGREKDLNHDSFSFWGLNTNFNLGERYLFEVGSKFLRFNNQNEWEGFKEGYSKNYAYFDIDSAHWGLHLGLSADYSLKEQKFGGTNTFKISGIWHDWELSYSHFLQLDSLKAQNYLSTVTLSYSYRTGDQFIVVISNTFLYEKDSLNFNTFFNVMYYAFIKTHVNYNISKEILNHNFTLGYELNSNLTLELINNYNYQFKECLYVNTTSISITFNG